MPGKVVPVFDVDDDASSTMEVISGGILIILIYI
jgi:hypothetical protein